MRALMVLLALTHPAPVTSIDALINPDRSVRIDWTLPADPGIVGVTILREHWSGANDVIFEIVGLSSTFTDASADPDRSYVYWVHTRNSAGELSSGAFVEVLGEDGDESWHCSSGVVSTPAGWPLIVLAGLASLLLVRPRRR